MQQQGVELGFGQIVAESAEDGVGDERQGRADRQARKRLAAGRVAQKRARAGPDDGRAAGDDRRLVGAGRARPDRPGERRGRVDRGFLELGIVRGLGGDGFDAPDDGIDRVFLLGLFEGNIRGVSWSMTGAAVSRDSPPPDC